MFKTVNTNKSSNRSPYEGRHKKRRKKNQRTSSFPNNHVSMSATNANQSPHANNSTNSSDIHGPEIFLQPTCTHGDDDNTTTKDLPITSVPEHTDALAYHTSEPVPGNNYPEGFSGQSTQVDRQLLPSNNNDTANTKPMNEHPDDTHAIAYVTPEPLPEEDCQQDINEHETQEDTPLELISNSPSDLDDNTDKARSVLHVARLSFRYLLKWERLLAFVAITGPEHFTASALRFMSIALDTATAGASHVPTYKTVRSAQWDFLVSHLFVPSKLLHIGYNYREAHRSERKEFVDTINNGKQDTRDCVRMVLPSDWAKLDCVTLPIYNDLFNSQRKDGRIGISIEHAPLVYDCDRSTYLSMKSSIWARYKKTVIPSSYSELLHYPVGKLLKYCDNDMEDEHWFTHSDSKVNFSCQVGPSWCVRTRPDVESRTASLHQEMIKNMSDDELLAYLCSIYATHQPTDFNIQLSRKVHAQTSTEEEIDEGDRHNCPLSYDKLFTFPGDLCVLLRQKDNIESAYIVHFIASHIWREQGRIGERIIWLNRTKLREQIASQASILELFESNESDRFNRDIIVNLIESDQCNLKRIFSAEVSRVDISQQVSVIGLPTFPENFEPSSIKKFSRSATNKGYLQDGTPYIVYRFFLYADGFHQKKSMSDKRSITGCYILPAGLPHQSRSTCTCVRTLTVAPDGIDTNEVLQHIVRDIVEGTVNGIDSYDAQGKKVRIFLDNISEVNDTPAQTSGNDLMGHSADSFCAFCGGRKRKKLPTPPICYSTAIHCRRP